MKRLYPLLLVVIASMPVGAADRAFDLPGLLGTWVPAGPGVEAPHQEAPRAHKIRWIHFLPNNEVTWSVVTGPTPDAKIRRGRYSLSRHGNLVHHGTKRVLLRIDPVPFDPAAGGVREDGTPILLLDVRTGAGIDNRFAGQTELLKFSTGRADLVFTRSKRGEGGVDAQPEAQEPSR